MATETKHEPELAESLIALVEKRQGAAIVRDDDPLPGSAVRRVHKVNTEIAEFIGANWPEICGTLRNARASDARIAELEAALLALQTAVNALPVEEWVEQERDGSPVLLGYVMQAQGEWDDVRKAEKQASAALGEQP